MIGFSHARPLGLQEFPVCACNCFKRKKKNLRLSYGYIQIAIDIPQKPLRLPLSLHLNFKLEYNSVKYMLIYDHYLTAVWNPLRNREESKSKAVNYSYEQ